MSTAGALAGAAALSGAFNHINGITNTIGGAIADTVGTTAQQAINGVMGHYANAASAQAQAAAGAFNQASADTANAIDSGRLTSQYNFNSAMMQSANDYNSMMWQRAADWNESMWERQAEFNAKQAEIQRQWSERMENTRYQRAIKDMESAGLNPILAVTGGGSGISTGAGTGTAASVGGAQISSATAQMASGGLLGADTASVNGYQGQMEFTGGILNLLAQAMNGIGSATQAMSAFGKNGFSFLQGLAELFSDKQQEKIDNALDYAEKNKSKPGDFPNKKNNKNNFKA